MESKFGGVGWFQYAKFEGSAKFWETTFHSGSDFRKAEFRDLAWFEGATFNLKSGFEQVFFGGKAEFGKTTFENEAQFRFATFGGEADFKGVTFGSHADFQEAEFRGHADFQGATIGDIARFTEVKFGNVADFQRTKFSGKAEFGETTFENEAQFRLATFIGEADFKRVTFDDGVNFKKTTFSSEAQFNETLFIGGAMFYRARFMSDARFDNAKFLTKKQELPREAGFNLAIFESYTSFYGAIFEYASTFVAIKGQSFFSLKNVRFLSIPDFEQANFSEAPTLDHSELVAAGNEKDVTIRWRALRRLAAQGHDYERELIFLAEEIKSFRDGQDKLILNPFNLLKVRKIWRGGGRYWTGLFYQLFSDFGRSTARPLLWLLITTAVFAFYFHYLSPHSNLDGNKPISISSCSDNPAMAALYLSVNNGLVISGLGRTEVLAKSYACLYGSEGKDGLSPKMPYKVVFAGIAQTIISAVLIFLFLLGLRNYFRIK